MLACPNKNTQEWKDLVAEFGEKGAFREYIKKGTGEIPSVKEVKQPAIGDTIVFYDEKSLDSVLKSKFSKAINETESDISFEQQKERLSRIGFNKALAESIHEGTLIQDKKTGDLYTLGSTESAYDYFRGESLLSYYEDGLNPADFFVYNLDPVELNDQDQVIIGDIDKKSPKFGVSEETFFKNFAIVGEYKPFGASVNEQGSIEFNRKAPGEVTKAVDDLIVKSLVEDLSSNLGIPYSMVTADEARELTADSKTPWNGEPAFFYAGGVYFVDGNVTLDNAFHEFSHPDRKSTRLNSSHRT